MKSNVWKTLAYAGGICAAIFPVCAAPLQRADITANPAWLLHLDCDALRPTTIGHYVLTEMDKPETKARLQEFQSKFGFDLQTQLHSLTVYGSGPAPAAGVLIVYADFDPAHLIAMAEAASDYQSTPHQGSVIHSWLDDKRKEKDGAAARTYAAIQGHRVIFGQREESVADALDVIAGRAPNLAAGKEFPQLGRASKGCFIEAAARKMKLPDSDPNATILKLSQSIQLVVGENGKQFTGSVTLLADDTEVSGHVLSIAQGLLALVKLQTDKPESVKAANAITLKQEGGSIVANMVLPATEVVDMIKAGAARKAAHTGKTNE